MKSNSSLRELLADSLELDFHSFLEVRSLLVLVAPQVLFLSAAVAAEGQHLTALLVNALVIAILGLGIVVFRFCWERFFRARPIHFAIGIAIALSLGLCKVLLTIALSGELLNQWYLNQQVQFRLISGSLSGVIAVVGAWIVVSKLRQFEVERNMLIEAELNSLSNLLTAKERKVIQQLLTKIQDQIATLRSSGSGQQAGLVADEIRLAVNRLLRPLSSSMFDVSGSTHLRFSVRSLFERATRANPPSIPVALSYLLVVSRNIDSVGLERAVPITLAISAGIFVALQVVIWLTSKLKINPVFRFLVISSTVPIFTIFTLLELVPDAKQLSAIEFLALSYWFTQTSIVFGMAKVTLLTAAANRRALRAIGDGTPALWAVRRRAKSIQMHGEVQSKLMSIALRGESGIDLSKQEMIEELKLVSNLIEATKLTKSDFESNLGELVQTWSGFAEVKIDPSVLLLPSKKAEVVSALIHEGVANAVRHGLASEISVSILNGRTLLIEDNGIGPTSGTSGLGSSLLSASSERWSLTARASGGSRLEVSLRLEAEK